MESTPERLSDRDLLDRIRRKDRNAFDELYGRYRDRVHRFIYRFVGLEAAEDVLQEAFYRLYARAHQYNPRWQVSTWLYTIARNASLEELRRRRRHPEAPLSEWFERTIRTGGDVDPAERAVRVDTSERIRRIIARLPERERAVYLLRHEQGLPHEEVARICRCSVRTVRNRMEKALLFLAREIEREGLMESE